MTGETRETDDVAGAARAARAREDGSTPAEGVEDEDEGTYVLTDPLPEPVDAAPQQVADLAAACVRFIGARYGATLDFSQETLSFVDQWVRDARPELGRRAELMDLVGSAAGAYLGEVIRRAFGGTWIVTEGQFFQWKLCLSTVYCTFNPIGMVREALILETADGWNAHFELDPSERDSVERRLAALPIVDDEEYYAPSTRFDVVAILVDALRGAMDARGLSEVRFTSEDYR
jgi:hypothetical protein